MDFKPDLVFDRSFSKLSDLIDSTFKLDKTYDFEFRFSTNPALVSYSNIFILTQKNKTWSARFFEYNGNSKLTEREVNQSQLDKLWKRLVANQILTLPTQDSIRHKMKIFIADTLNALDEDDPYQRVAITDGVVYYFELTTQNKRRSYDYQCPKGYLKHFPNIEELYRAYVIIVLRKKYLGLSLEVC